MSNVLPKTTQSTVWRFYRNRFLFVGGVAALSTACVAILVLIPSFVATRTSHEKYAEEPLASSPKEEIEKERAEILHARSLIQELAPVMQKTKTFEALLEVLAARPNGISIQSIDIKESTDEKRTHTIVIAGSAVDRTRVSDYRSALAKLPFFDSVTVPVGALAGAGEGRFSITLSGTF
ncbi:hypothetical protein C4585_03015 [Candidatus Parcubacteria bacterium]|nr:MAG: hypothetical protein C4585_03015 [Candidatus Parcubacteria bacterium]